MNICLHMKACLYLGIAPLRPMLNLQNSSESSVSILISLGLLFFDSFTPFAFLLLLFPLFAAFFACLQSSLLASTLPGVAPGIFRWGADSSDEGAKIWLSGYYKCQKSPKKSHFHLLIYLVLSLWLCCNPFMSSILITCFCQFMRFCQHFLAMTIYTLGNCR